MTPPDTLLVIPTCRDGARLAEFLPELCAELAAGPGGVLVQVVDDGSSAREQMWLTKEIERMREEHAFLQPLLLLPVNHGKGYAIRAGWATAVTERWLAFVDADGAVPATEVVALLQSAKNYPTPAMFVAARTPVPGKTVQRFWHRQIGSRMFNAWVRYWLGLDLSDTQCGLKAIPTAFFAGDLSSFGGPVSRRAEPGQSDLPSASNGEKDSPSDKLLLWREDGFAFDLELLLRARATGLPVITQPISWNEHGGSTFGPEEMLGLFAAACRLRRKNDES